MAHALQGWGTAHESLQSVYLHRDWRDGRRLLPHHVFEVLEGGSEDYEELRAGGRREAIRAETMGDVEEKIQAASNQFREIADHEEETFQFLRESI